MTRKQLSEIYFLNKELKMWENELTEIIESSQIKSQQLDGMPFQNTGETSDKVMEIAVKIIEHSETVNALRLKIQKKTNEIDRYIQSLDDSFLRMIIEYRCCKLLTWREVSAMIGNATSPEGCRKYFERNVKN